MLRSMHLFLALSLAAPSAALAVPSCPTDEHRQELSDFEARLRGADSVDEARELALRKVKHSRQAVNRAAKIVPGDEQLLEHQAQLQEFADGVAASQSQAEVAEQFATLRTQRVGAGCDFSTGEIIAIVLGFILGIIPGIILLILLC